MHDANWPFNVHDTMLDDDMKYDHKFKIPRLRIQDNDKAQIAMTINTNHNHKPCLGFLALKNGT